MTTPESTRDRVPRPGRQLVRALLSIDSFGPVILAILVSYVLAATVTGDGARAIVLFAQIGTVWLVFRVSGSHSTVRQATNVLLVLAGIAAIVDLFFDPGDVTENMLFAASCALYFIAPAAVVRHVAKKPEVDLDTILAAVSAYLLIGMFFAFAYRWLGEIQTEPLFGADGVGTMADDLFFSFTTLLTIGYGNLVPTGTTGQTMAVIEGLTGTLFLIVAVAKVVAAWQPAATRRSDDPS